MIKVLIADDHPIVRQGLRQILSDISDMKVAGEAANAQETLDQVGAGGWDVLVLDITMPDRTGFDILKELKHAQPDLPVLVLSIHAEEHAGLRPVGVPDDTLLPRHRPPQRERGAAADDSVRKA